MKAKQIKENIYWVGAIDFNVREFHGYNTKKGSTYNAYLIIDEKITLIDTVKKTFASELLHRIKSVVDPSKIDYIIVNHVEMDHSGSLTAIMEQCPNATIITNAAGEKGLNNHYNNEWKYQIIKSGDSLNLGKYDLSFVQTPMVHWPDSMVSYLPQEKILFPNDAFGQHYASSERWDEEVPFDLLMFEAMNYYGNIVMPFGKQVQKAIGQLANLDIEMICPSHGLCWKKHIPDILAAYQKWSTNQTVDKAVIIWDTMWGATDKIANAIGSAFENKGISYKLMNLKANHISDIMAELVEAKYIAIGSPTLNNQIMPPVAALMCYVEGLAPKGRVGIAFGSYGWSGQSIGIIDDWMKKIGWATLPITKIQYAPTHEDLKECVKRIEEEL